MDGSTVYGSTPELLRSLRSDVDGLLKIRTSDGKEYLPASENCNTNTNACFLAGIHSYIIKCKIKSNEIYCGI